MHPQQQQKKGIKIDAKFLRTRKLNCANCENFEEVETEFSDKVGMCNAFSFKGGSRMTARGARSEDKWCGMRGTQFKPKEQVDDDVKLIEEMTLDELNEIDVSDLTKQDKSRITKHRNKLLKAMNNDN